MNSDAPTNSFILPKTYLFCGNEAYKGVCVESLYALEKRITELFLHTIKYCSSETFSPDSWQPMDLAVFPGGTCSEWDELLGKAKLKDFLAWFERGGRVLAVCAGAYYFSSHSIYQAAMDNSISRLRDAALFSGLCQGPVFDPGVQVVKIHWEETQQEGYAITIGAGALIPQEPGNGEYRVLARFVDNYQKDSIAVVSCKKGNGVGILSTVHWEFDSLHLLKVKCVLQKTPEQMQVMMQNLDRSASFRESCFKKIMSELITRPSTL